MRENFWSQQICFFSIPHEEVQREKFILLYFRYYIMSELTIEVLKQVVEKLPDDFVVGFDDLILSDKFEVDVSSKKLVLKKY